MRKLSWWKVVILILAGLTALFFLNEWRVERQWQRYAEDARKRLYAPEVMSLPADPAVGS